jgi:hypothetical protein
MRRFLFLAALLLLPTGAHGQASPDAAMSQVAERSPLFQQARRTVIKAIDGLGDAEARRLTRGALLAPDDCVQHRVGLNLARQRQIVEALVARGFLDGKGTRDAVSAAARR